MAKRLLVVHGGAPSPVLNESLLGVILEGKRRGFKVLGALGGVEGVLNRRFAELDMLSDLDLSLLSNTPGTVIGTSRYNITREDYGRLREILTEQRIDALLLNGGNGTMNTCGTLRKECGEIGVCVVGIPKTVDNDIEITDHCPGFGSAARYLAGITQEIGEDVFSLPIHITVIEAMGRNTGWLAAASILAKKRPEDAPHLIYMPEHPFDESEFLRDAETIWKRGSGVVVVASEGLRNKHGEPVVKPTGETARSIYFGEVANYLAALAAKELGVKTRSEKPGLCSRTSIPWVSQTDRKEARLVGEAAVSAADEGKTGCMVALIRNPDSREYEVRTELVPIEKVMLYEKKLPDKYINMHGNGVTDDFIKWCAPLIGPPLPDMLRLKERML